ncbi:UNVERIFIED_CONTAM: hypothetical protein K2H54_032865 [Gekko kuhli]
MEKGFLCIVSFGWTEKRFQNARASEVGARAQEGFQESRDQDAEEGRQKAQEEPQGELLHLRVQGAEAGPPGHWHLLQGHEHHELLRQRHLRAHRRRGLPPGPLQQALHHHLPRDPDGRAPPAARGAGQARRLRGHQGRHQVHQLQVTRLQAVPPPLRSHPRITQRLF